MEFLVVVGWGGGGGLLPHRQIRPWFLVNNDWTLLLPNSAVTSTSAQTYDHNQLLLKLSTIIPRSTVLLQQPLALPPLLHNDHCLSLGRSQHSNIGGLISHRGQTANLKSK
jgi:hypothetical protein